MTPQIPTPEEIARFLQSIPAWILWALEWVERNDWEGAFVLFAGNAVLLIGIYIHHIYRDPHPEFREILEDREKAARKKKGRKKK